MRGHATLPAKHPIERREIRGPASFAAYGLDTKSQPFPDRYCMQDETALEQPKRWVTQDAFS